MIAENAQKIIAARANGQKPADMVLVGLGGKIETENPVVYAKAGQSYDWRWARNLDVCLYVSDADDWSAIAVDIAKARPTYFAVWNIDGQWGATVYLIPRPEDIGKPPALWRYELDFALWHDFQNNDFINRRSYARDEKGFPYAVGS